MCNIFIIHFHEDERDDYKLLRNEETFNDLQSLADFWDAVEWQDEEVFSKRVLRELFILNYAPNKMWTYFTSVYFLTNKDTDNKLDDQAFYEFLHKTIAFVWVGGHFINVVKRYYLWKKTLRLNISMQETVSPAILK